MNPITLPRGTILAQRFVLEQPTGRGGMGTVYRSRDLQSGAQVAIKLMHAPNKSEALVRRFVREAQLLAELHHPSIVAYLTHGHTHDGWPFLVMEWLEGESLSARLATSRLTLHESLSLARDIAAALAVAHRRGVIHRDLKPSNLYLRDFLLGRVTLIDFGIARPLWESTALTRIGDVIGTPRYMAPEQAQGRKDIGPASDVYSLGCILFECLTGRVPLDADHAAALLTKILFQYPPPLRSLRPDLPQALEELLQRMLAKQPDQRPADAVALLGELAALPAMADLRSPATSGSQTARLAASGEAQLVSVVVADRGADQTVEMQSLDSLGQSPAKFDRTELRAALSIYSNQVDVLLDGSAVVTLANTHKSSATDQAMQAARCALSLKERWPDAQVVLATGRGVIAEQGPLGEAIDRAVGLLGEPAQEADPTASPVILDEVTAGLLDMRFEVAPGPRGGAILLSERTEFDPGRPLLGRPTPCVGRERELGVLEGLFSECRDESVPHVVLITAPPGLGKSRLRHELVRRLHGRGEPVEILLGRGDPMSAGSPYGLLGQALRRLCGIIDGEPLPARRSKLTERVHRHQSGPQAQRMAEFLGELCEVPFPDEASAPLQAARQDPHLMSDQLTQTALDFLKAEGEKAPLLLILEDLHWGDGLTVRLVDLALRQLRSTPLLVLALARPEVEDLFPRLWADRQRQDLRLNALKTVASERLVRQVLGPQVAAATIQRIVQHAGGNALYLEELIRAEAEGKGEALPETVLVMVQARLMRLTPGARATLRAASVYGQTFWRGGLQSPEADHWLQILLDAEFIEHHRESRFPDEREYGFRNALLREAAYSFLSAEELQKGHEQAAQYLERAGELDPIVLAEHSLRGGDLRRASAYYTRAAEQALERNDLTETLRRADCGLTTGAEGEQRGMLCALKASALFFRNEVDSALRMGSEALAHLPPGTPHWFRAIGYASMSATVLGQLSMVRELAGRMGTVVPPASAYGSYFETGSMLATMLGLMGDREMAELFLSRLQRVDAQLPQNSPIARAWMHYALGRHQNALQPAPWSAVAHFQHAVEAVKLVGDRRQLAFSLGDLGFALARLGASAAAEASLREGLQIAAQLDEPVTLIWVKMYLALLLAERGEDAAEARQLCHAIFQTVGEDSYYGGVTHCALAAVHSAAGAWEQARASADKALRVLRPTRSSAPLGYLAVARARLLSGSPAAAAQAAAEGVAAVEAIGGSGGSEVPLRLALVHALRASGTPAQAEAAQRELDHQIELRAAQIPPPELRASFLARIRGDSGALPIF